MKPHAPLRSLVLLLALLAPACGGEEEMPVPAAAPDYDAAETARLEEAMQSLQTVTHRVRAEVLRTCDKWRHIDRPCVENEVRRDQLDCWLREGLKAWQSAQARNLGPFTGDRATMRMQNLCMSQRRWRKVDPGHRF